MLAVLSVVVVNIMLGATKGFAEIRATRDLIDGGQNVMERITREIRSTTSVDNANSTFDSSPGVLTINNLNSAGSAKITKFAVVSNKLQLTEDGVVSGNLVGANVNVTNLTFTRITVGSGGGVRIQMTLQDTRASGRTEKFYSTVMFRQNY